MERGLWLFVLVLAAAMAEGSSSLIENKAERPSCPEGWVDFENHCYFFSEEMVTWAQARAVCRGSVTGADLVSISTEAELAFVQGNLATSSCWIGFGAPLADDVWVLNDGAPGGSTWNVGGCVEMSGRDGGWRRLQPCDHTSTAVCEAPTLRITRGTLQQLAPAPESGCWERWTEDPATGECYLLLEEEMTFLDARDQCASLGEDDVVPDLVSLSTIQEQNFVYRMLVADQSVPQRMVWVGMKNMVNNYWVDGSPVGYYNFAPGEPDGYGDGYICIGMRTDTGLWKALPCTLANAFVCEVKGSNYVGPVVPRPPPAQCPFGWSYWESHCYYVSSNDLSWTDAQAWCHDNLATELISITSEEENSFILGRISEGSEDLWLGLEVDEDGQWRWVDGSAMNYTHWLGDLPPTTTGSSKCIKIRADSSASWGYWVDDKCDQQLRYACKMLLKTCPEGWTYHERKCYHGSGQEMSWDAARAACQGWDPEADLVSIHSFDENFFVAEVMSNASLGSWIGLLYNLEMKQWTWSDGQDADFTLWNVGEPNNLQIDRCAEITKSLSSDNPASWSNLACDSSRASGCELLPSHLMGCEDGWWSHDGYCYWYSHAEDTHRIFQDARWDCQVRGGDLVSIHTQEENDFITTIVSSYNCCFHMWLGMSDEDHWNQIMWVDGSPLTFTLWKAISDINLKYHPVCGYRDGYSETSQWGLGTCYNQRFYMCKKPMMVTPIIPPDTHCRYGDGEYGRSCYSFPGFSHSWLDANNICTSMNGSLVVLNDRAESAFLSVLLSQLGSKVWIGLAGNKSSDDSVTLQWVSQDTVTFTQWGINQPDPRNGTCVVASGTGKPLGSWSLRPCNLPLQYICEYEREGHLPTTLGPTLPPPAGGCLSDWTLHGYHCYRVYVEAKTWAGAEDLCSSHGGHLLSLGSAEELLSILSLPDLSEIPASYKSIWVGLTTDEETGYQWSDGSPFTYISWAKDQPNSLHGRENCGSADKYSFKLSISMCDAHLPFICKAEPGTMLTTLHPLTMTPSVACDDDPLWILYDKYCYKLTSEADGEPLTWWDSHLQCRKEGGELASIHTYEENYWLESQIFRISDTSLWIGGRALMDSGFTWVDETPFDFDNWDKGEPNSMYDAEDCVALYSHRQGYWNDQNCGYQQGHVCKRPHGATLPPQPTTELPNGTCPSGWIHAGSNCLRFYPEKKTFEEARMLCKDLEGQADLASFHSPEDQAYLTAAVGQLGTDLWLGMHNTDGFHWVDQSAVTYTNWAVGEPNRQEQMSCVRAYAVNGQWDDTICDQKNGYVCKKQQEGPDTGALQPCEPPLQNYLNYSGVCYRTYSTPKTWHDAEETCVGEGSHLASLKEVTEGAMVWVLSLQDDCRDAWIGFSNLHDQHQFIWSDGWPTTYTNWGPNQPNASLTDHNCVRLDSHTGLWISEKCNQWRPFICKYQDEEAPTPEPPVTGHCPSHDWLDLGGAYCYLTGQMKRKWIDASISCAQAGANLISIHSEDESSLIMIAISSIKDSIWTGLVQTSNGYGWGDGTGLDFINWEAGEPGNNSLPCVVMSTTSGTWLDVDCSSSHPYVCKVKKSGDGHQTEAPTNPSHALSDGQVAGIVVAVVIAMVGLSFIIYVYITTWKRSVATTDPLYSYEVQILEGTTSDASQI
ncbi:macrophage mannose receptor 1-like isoform X2 [Panulirus ornatus]|uniref:macrophage mannose receptor 1-like isoform X2 n=1 Tax=Panulirus ornatus TaxID=150431 RepID=UPI003A8A3F17